MEEYNIKIIIMLTVGICDLSTITLFNMKIVGGFMNTMAVDGSCLFIYFYLFINTRHFM